MAQPRDGSGNNKDRVEEKSTHDDIRSSCARGNPSGIGSKHIRSHGDPHEVLIQFLLRRRIAAAHPPRCMGCPSDLRSRRPVRCAPECAGQASASRRLRCNGSGWQRPSRRLPCHRQRGSAGGTSWKAESGDLIGQKGSWPLRSIRPHRPRSRRVSLDATDPAFYQDPYAAYEAIRAVAPVFFWEELGMWCLTGYDVVNGSSATAASAARSCMSQLARRSGSRSRRSMCGPSTTSTICR